MNNRESDIIIAGGGRLGIKVLLDVAERVKSELQGIITLPVKVVLVHDEDSYGGAAYDHHLSPIPLPFHQAVRDIEREPDFIDWLEKNIDRVFEFISLYGGDRGEMWLQLYKKEYKNKNYGEIRLPRAVYGLYLCDRVFDLLLECHLGEHILDITLLHGKIINPQKKGNGYTCNLDNQASEMEVVQGKGEEYTFPKLMPVSYTEGSVTLESSQLVLCPGSMPNALHKNVIDNPFYFHSLYESGKNFYTLHSTILSIYSETKQRVKILIGGSGASAMDVLCWLSYNRELVDKVDLSIISTSEPDLTYADSSERGKKGDLYIPFSGEEHVDLQCFSEIESMIQSEIRIGEQQGFSQVEVVASLASIVFPAIYSLSVNGDLGTFLSGLEYIKQKYYIYNSKEMIDMYYELLGQSHLHFIQGKILHDELRYFDGSFLVKYGEQGGYNHVTGDIFVNCMGSIGKNIDEHNCDDREKNPAIALQETGLSEINALRKGVHTDEHYQLVGPGGVNEGLFVGGFLAAGNLVNGFPVNGGNPDGVAKIIGQKIMRKLIK